MSGSNRSVRPMVAVALSTVTLTGAALAQPAASVAKAKHGKAVRVTVKVYGKAPAYKKLLKRTVRLSAKPVARYGGSCSGRSAIGALQAATEGKWSGSWDAEYSDYEVTKIEGLNLPFKSKAAANWFWSFWIGGKEASAGVCEVMPKSGQTVMFKPACFGKACPKVGVKAKGARAKRRGGR